MKDMAGLTFGRLTVLVRHPNKHGETRAYWYCLCECGGAVVTSGKSLRKGHTQSCGCLKRDIGKIRAYKHGLIHTREYRAWSAAKTRCYNPKIKAFKDYGGRGITMADVWRDDFAAFYRDMGQCPARHSLDRIDNNRAYEPGNCRWSDKIAQANNTRFNKNLTFQGKTLSVSAWERERGWKNGTLKRRLLLDWTIARALSTPIRHW